MIIQKSGKKMIAATSQPIIPSMVSFFISSAL
jgi:hypothetical protein